MHHLIRCIPELRGTVLLEQGEGCKQVIHAESSAADDAIGRIAQAHRLFDCQLSIALILVPGTSLMHQLLYFLRKKRRVIITDPKMYWYAESLCGIIPAVGCDDKIIFFHEARRD